MFAEAAAVRRDEVARVCRYPVGYWLKHLGFGAFDDIDVVMPGPSLGSLVGDMARSALPDLISLQPSLVTDLLDPSALGWTSVPLVNLSLFILYTRSPLYPDDRDRKND